MSIEIEFHKVTEGYMSKIHTYAQKWKDEGFTIKEAGHTALCIGMCVNPHQAISVEMSNNPGNLDSWLYMESRSRRIESFHDLFNRYIFSNAALLIHARVWEFLFFFAATTGLTAAAGYYLARVFG